MECEICGNPYGDYAEHNYEYSVCTVCWKNEGSEGLTYEENPDGQSYKVVGTGYCTDTHVSIPNYYNQKPVTAIGDYAFFNKGNNPLSFQLSIINTVSPPPT